jgi:hypothetical protein
MNDTFTATAANIAADAIKPKRTPLTEEQKEVLRKRLDVARVKRSEMAKAGLLKRPTCSPKPKPQNLANETLTPASTFTVWSDDDWRAAPFDQAMQRLRDLTADRERGSNLVTQRRADEHIGNVYHCIVCRKLVPDGRWIWKNDRRDPLTNMYTSDVLCSQICHERFSNNVKFYMDRAKGVS